MTIAVDVVILLLFSHFASVGGLIKSHGVSSYHDSSGRRKTAGTFGELTIEEIRERASEAMSQVTEAVSPAQGGGFRHARHTSTCGGAKLRVAFATLLTIDPAPGKFGKLDGAGVLAESIRIHMGHLDPSFVAIVTPAVREARPILEKFGYAVLERKPPDLDSIQNRRFRNLVVDSGCCGVAEMLKLEAYRMVDYDRVVMMDDDMLVHHSFEELLCRPENTLYTAPYKKTSNEYLQGSFLVVRPDVRRVEEILTFWRMGNYGDHGWEHSGIGYSYGGETIQGILPFYWREVRPDEAAEVDHCVYNNNGDANGMNSTATPYCPTMPASSAKVNHFTACQKPWYCCPLSIQSAACGHFTREWWSIHKRLAKRLNRTMPPSNRQRCSSGNYYVDGMSSAYTPLLPEGEPVTDGW